MNMKTTMKRIGSALMAICLISTISITAFAASFTDVPESHWSYQYVEKAHTNGLINGTGNGQYTPDKDVSNAEWSQMVYNLFCPEDLRWNPAQGAPWYFRAIEWYHEWEIISGTVLASMYTGTTERYKPADCNATINRYDMAQVIYNLAHCLDGNGAEFIKISNVDTSSVSTKIADYQQIPSNYRTAVEYCYAAGFITGTDQLGTFAGTDPMTRGAAATVLCRLFDAKNGNWTAPDNNDGTTPTNPIPTITAVKDMIKVTKNGETNSIIVVNLYTADKLSNGKDINTNNITAMLDEIKAMFPAGTSWGDGTNGGEKYYYSSRTPAPAGGGCNAWAGMVGDTIFGKGAKWTSTTDFNNIKVGDLIEFKNNAGVATHWVVVTGVTTETTTILVNGVPTQGPVDTFITLCDGNSGAQVQWGGGLWLNAEILKGSPNSVLYSAY